MLLELSHNCYLHWVKGFELLGDMGDKDECSVSARTGGSVEEEWTDSTSHMRENTVLKLIAFCILTLKMNSQKRKKTKKMIID